LLFGGCESGFRLVDEQRELRGIGRSGFRENLSVEVDAGELEAMHQGAVSETGFAGGGADADDPEGAVFALLLFAADIGELEGAFYRFLRGTVQFAFGEEVALGEGKRLFAVVSPLGTTFNSWHVSSPVGVSIHAAGGHVRWLRSLADLPAAARQGRTGCLVGDHSLQLRLIGFIRDHRSVQLVLAFA